MILNFRVIKPPGGISNLNLFGKDPHPEGGSDGRQREVNRCQYERNKSSITEQYCGRWSLLMVFISFNEH